MADRIVQTSEKARQGHTPGSVRYILLISTLLVIIAFALAYGLSV